MLPGACCVCTIRYCPGLVLDLSYGNLGSVLLLGHSSSSWLTQAAVLLWLRQRCIYVPTVLLQSRYFGLRVIPAYCFFQIPSEKEKGGKWLWSLTPWFRRRLSVERSAWAPHAAPSSHSAICKLHPHMNGR